MLRLSSTFWAIALLLAARPGFAQDDQVTFRADTRLVVLHMSVVDKSGKLITDLPQGSFKVFENNVEQQIRVFRREDIPVSIGIIVDNSGSMRDKRQRVETAAISLVKASNKLDEVFIVNFNDEAYLDVPFTNDIKKMEEGIAQINSRGGTAMRDAISMSIDYLKTDGKRDKKVLLVITDGNDTASSGISLEKLVEKCQKSNVLIYGIGLLGKEEPGDAKKAKRAVTALTTASGGISFYPDNVEEVEKTCLQVAHDIRNQYVLGYSPINQNLDGGFRTIKVAVAGGKFTVRTRTGYYATPEAHEQQRKTAGGSH